MASQSIIFIELFISTCQNVFAKTGNKTIFSVEGDSNYRFENAERFDKEVFFCFCFLHNSVFNSFQCLKMFLRRLRK